MKYFRKILESWLCVLCMLATTCTSKPILANDTEINKPHSECLENNSKLVIKGFDIRISDLFKVPCMAQAKYIEVFAVNILVIDADIDKTGKEAQITLIAPTLAVSGARKIVLNGRDNNDKPDKNANNQPGRPGNPGQSSGSILGIGKQFINAAQLFIQLNGGKGGTGQIGAKGRNSSISDILFTNCSDSSDCVIKWKADKRIIHTGCIETARKFVGFFNFVQMECLNSLSSIQKHINGVGYHGGAGGFGGKGGESHFFGFKKRPEIVLEKGNGKRGDQGKGGEGGAAKEIFASVVVRFVNIHLNDVIYQQTKPKYEGKSTKIPAGKNGVAGKNSKGIQQPANVSLFKPTITINRYESYLFDWLADNSENQNETSNVLEFLDVIENEKGIQSLYDTLGFIDKLERIEEQYLRLHEKVDIQSYMQSLMTRVKKYARTHPKPDHKSALNILYTTITSKLINLRFNENHATVLNLTGYLELVKGRFKALENYDYFFQHVNQTKYEDKKVLMRATESSLKLTKTSISPDVQATFDKQNSKILILIEELKKIFELKSVEKVKREEVQRKLKASLSLHFIMNVVKVGDVVARFLAAIGQDIATIMDMLVFEENKNWWFDSSSFRDGKNDRILRDTLASLNSTVTDTNEIFFKEVTLFRMQLEDVEKVINDGPGFDSSVVAKINKTKKQLKLIQRHDSMVPILINTLRHELVVFLKVENKRENKTIQQKKLCENIRKIVNIGEAGIEIYSQVRSNFELLEAVAMGFDEIENQTMYWKKVEIDIYWELVLMMRHVQVHLHINDSLADGPNIGSELLAWNVQDMLYRIKGAFERVFNGKNSQPDIARCAENINEAMTILITVYDRIDSYYDRSRFFTFFTNMLLSGPTTNIKDPELKAAVSNLTNIIHSNVIFQEYEEARLQFNRHYFPFAQYHSNKFHLNTHINFNDPEKLLRHIIRDFDNFIEIKQDNGVYDAKVIHNSDCIFYRWTDRDVITKLMAGNEIIVKADIKKGLPVNAIKFKQLELKISTADGNYPFESIFRNYDVHMTMMGHFVYKCGKRNYYIPVTNVALEYSVRKNANGSPMRANLVYRKFENNNPFLSPYALWKIQLNQIIDHYSAPPSSNESFDFQNKTLYLELHGDGQYFNDEKTASEVCTEELNKYYKYYDEQM